MRRAQVIFAFAAVALFVWVVAHVGLPVMMVQLKALRIALPIVVALSALRLLLQSSTWSASLRRGNVPVNTVTLMGVRVASQSMGYLTVLGPVLSEPMKVKLLGTSSEPTIAATFLDTGVYWLTSTLVAVSGIVSLALIPAHGAAYHWTPAILFLAALVVVITRRNAILPGLARAFGERTPSWLARAERWEASIRNYRLEQPALVGRMFWTGVLCQLLIASEVVVVLWSLHLPIHFIGVMAIEGVTRALKLVSGWIPARIGADEGGAMSAFGVVGLSPMLGLSLALTRRVRDLLWALTGVVWLVWNSRSSQFREMSAAGYSTERFEGGI